MKYTDREDTDIERICNTVIEIISKVKNDIIIVEGNNYQEALSKYIHIFYDINDYLKTELKKEQHRIFMENIMYTSQEDISELEKEKDRIFKEEREKIRSLYNSALEPNCSINYEPLINLVQEKLQKRKLLKEKEFCMRMNQRVCISGGTDENNVEKLEFFDISKDEDLVRIIKKLKDEEGIRKEECEKLKSEALHADDVVDIEINPKDLKIDIFGECPGVRITHIPTCTVVDCMEYPLQYKNKDCAMKQLKEKLLESGYKNEKK